MDTTGRAFFEHWKWAADRGLMKENTAGGFQAAVGQVLTAIDGWEGIDVSAIDPEETFRRFVNKRGRDFSPTTLATYKRRFTMALADFKAYVEGPERWKPSGRERTHSKKSDGDKVQGSVAKKTKVLPAKGGTLHVEQVVPDVLAAVGTAAGAATVAGRTAGLVEYPFPLTPGRFAFLRLPADLKVADVKKLAAYLTMLAEDAPACK